LLFDGGIENISKSHERKEKTMKRVLIMLWVVVLSVTIAVPAAQAADDMATKLNAVLAKGPEAKFSGTGRRRAGHDQREEDRFRGC
jgi:hypothetical protein